jgi:ribosomal protein S18 acetylase RimI-like enzyme
MKRVENIQKWDNHITKKVTYITDDCEVIGSYDIQYGDEIILRGLYIQDKYKGLGFSKRLIEEIIEDINDDIYLEVRKDNFIVDTYKKYGFDFYSEDDIYIWMLKKYN